MSVQAWTYVMVALTFGLYLTIAWRTRVKDTRGFYVAGRGVPAIANGMATGADWMSAASFISMAGLISTMGYAGGMYLMGWTGGYVLLALLLAPYLRKFGKFTVPDFVGDRFSTESSTRPGDSTFQRILHNPARFVAVLCAIFVSFVYVAGQMQGVGIVFARFLEVDINTGVTIGMIIVFIYATLGGMKGITWTQVAQYWVLITAFLIPAFAISFYLTGIPLPQVGMGSRLADGTYLLDKLNQLNHDFGFAGYTEPFAGAWNRTNVVCTTLALMVGTAGLPHVIVRFYTVKSVRAARWSAFWALFFIALLYLTAPATAAFARYYMIEQLQGKSQAELPQWFHNWRQTRLIVWLDDGDGRVRYSNDDRNEIFRADAISQARWETLLVNHQRWLDRTGGEDARPILRREKYSGPHVDIIVLATPEMANLSNWIIALVAAGGLAAALSTASGLLLVISSSIAHDLYARVIDPSASEARRLLVGRTVIGLAVVVAGILGIYPPGFVSQVVAFAFGLAASSFFPVIVLGIFSKRVGMIPAVMGMIVGIGFTASYIIGNIYGGMPAWFFGIGPQGIGTIGMLFNFTVTLGLTPFFPPPPSSVQALIDSIREPEGAGPAVEIETAPEH
jgi:cation/acetate symporter